MMRFILIAVTAILATVVDGTSVAVLEYGNGGAAHSTTTSSPLTTAAAVGSFWSSMHFGVKRDGKPRRYSKQHPGMTVVPDMFIRPDGGFAIGISGQGIDLEVMPTVAALLKENDDALGHFYVNGDFTEKLMDKASAGYKVKTAAFKNDAMPKMNYAVDKAGPNSLEAVHVNVLTKDEAADVDSQIADVLSSLAKLAEESGSTVIVHIVIDDQTDNNDVADSVNAAIQKKGSKRRLEDENENADQDQAETYNNNLTIFQIQYYNVVLWTAIGLVIVLFTSINLFMNMPLMPDTLLFGESAKMMGE
mmetsp:Transcript_11436/g.10947  ORF Transcript_11436/g.10947 Transcript_11436/m.10947 type:complete len:305 (-) Transcript_11436:153-1067(-)|eukprot:CAMPEP_0197834278 /NCGR_PEP_ID=MMETSP1437-20131217/21877_1 /TAXON_ID=49252 ORGANISM="Eucampia antarctica, Strain CCMP1452" /NCGR_SAMPLE_ID=MMETSP1437 /ASSEMBLY_ACC=CAM_ASM_001096 /LENGTH=304 /DNA_ID=CAMNT_0043438845 /DNA_START=65 /DNA_END=979 /DNA_ORIENTATION=+